MLYDIEYKQYCGMVKTIPYSLKGLLLNKCKDYCSINVRITAQNMKGLQLDEEFYREYGQPLVKKYFPEYEGKICAGVCGRGSECYGFDDEFSRDHDFRVGFWFWINEQQDATIGFRLARAYAELPVTYKGVSPSEKSEGARRVFGVIPIGDFFHGLIGKSSCFDCVEDWFYTPEYAMSAATNGKVFCEGEGEFSRFRSNLMDVPKDVFYKKLAARLALCAQSGQYNFGRCLKRGEYAAAALALSQFAENAARAVFLTEGVFAPYYKWLIRAMSDSACGGVKKDINELLCRGLKQKGDTFSGDEAEEKIEIICDKLRSELVKRGLYSGSETYLMNAAAEIQSKIVGRTLSAMHVLECGG